MTAHLLGQASTQIPAIYRTNTVPVTAGFPSPSQDYEETEINLNKELIRDQKATWVLAVTGNSMIGAGIADGDQIIVDTGLEARKGNVIVARLDGEYTVKRLRIDDRGQGWLCPENPEYPAIPIPENSEFTIFGVVTRCLHYVH